MTGADPTRRRFVLGAAVGGIVGLAGCTSDGAPAGDGGTDDGGTSTATATDTPTATATETPTAERTTTPGSGDEFCAPIRGSPTPFDVSGTPYVFQFDYVDSWSVGEPIRQSRQWAERLESPVLTSEDGESSATVRVAQALEPVTEAEAEERIQERAESDESNGIAYEDEFDGETVAFVEFPNVDVNSYVAYLPYGDGEARYYTFSLVTFIEGGGEGRNVSDCTDAVNVATQTVRESLSVNPESTADQG